MGCRYCLVLLTMAFLAGCGATHNPDSMAGAGEPVDTTTAKDPAGPTPEAASNDRDSDGDRIPDRDDHCPSQQETYNGEDDDDGCPDRRRVALHAEPGFPAIVYFAHEAAAISPASQPVVDSVVAILATESAIEAVEIQGHAATSEQDPDALSRQRAVAVKRALMTAGIDERRLEVRGYGDTEPRSQAMDEAGWSANRRVEFRLLRMTAPGP